MRVTIAGLQHELTEVHRRLRLSNDTVLIRDRQLSEMEKLKDNFRGRCSELDSQNRFMQRITENLSEALKGKAR